MTKLTQIKNCLTGHDWRAIHPVLRPLAIIGIALETLACLCGWHFPVGLGKLETCVRCRKLL